MAKLKLSLNFQLSPLFDSFPVHVAEGFPSPPSNPPRVCVVVRLRVSAGPRSARCDTIFLVYVVYLVIYDSG